MNTAKLKRFAPECRTQLIEQVGVKLDYVLTAKTPDLAEKEALLKELRRALKTEGREGLIERVAYIWFNRFAAFRFLDAHNWHPFKMRLVTSAKADEVLPELLQQVRQGVLPEELKAFVPMDRVHKLLDGQLASTNPQAEVQRLLVIGVSAYYAKLMPFLFDKIDAFTELLLPDDLLTEHSVVSGFITDMTDDDCSEVEVLGWLYQFYISEKKDAVMARKKAVPSEDIPAVTQLFTPHWIVRYLVENSLGRLWLRSRPNSRLKEHMPYYVEDPEGQTPADSLTVATPEEIKLLDPACGSGHMLTYAFELLVKIYEEEGHAPSEIPEKILTHNLFGLEICPRAAQLASFALVCKAREQSRRAFRSPVQPQVMCLRDVVLTPEDMQAWSAATGVKLSQDELAQIHQFREHTETFGALIQPVLDFDGLTKLREKIHPSSLSLQPSEDLLVQNTHRKLCRVLDQAEMLSQRYQVVVANPPYMGGGGMIGALSNFMKNYYPNGKADLFGAFIERCSLNANHGGYIGMITPPSWLFLPAFESLRADILQQRSINSLLHMGRGVFGIDWGSTAFVIGNEPSSAPGRYFRLHKRNFQHLYFEDIAKIFLNAKRDSAYRFNFDLYRDESGVKEIGSESHSSGQKIAYSASSKAFELIPGCPIAYWASSQIFSVFSKGHFLSDISDTKQGIATGDNGRFLRFWYEIDKNSICLTATSCQNSAVSSATWFPYSKGGPTRKWYGNLELVVNWRRDGEEIRSFVDDSGKLRSRPQNLDFQFREAATWSLTSSSGRLAGRFRPSGCMFDINGMSAFPAGDISCHEITSILCSSVSSEMLRFLNPTLAFQSGDIARIPLPADIPQRIESTSSGAVEVARADWDNFETSWDFRDLPLLRSGDWEVESGQSDGPWKGRTLAESWANYAAYCSTAIRRMQELETENNRLWIDAYGLQDELTPEVPAGEITLARADKRKDVAAFLSYAVGCMMGRYSLDHPSLILADAGDTLERYLEKVGKSKDEVSFLPDEDAIIPITEDEWFEDDAAARVREFLRVTFGPETLEDNLAFIKEALGKDLRKYFTANTGGFYTDHVQTYKKRPIYWMFESPKKHFRALVYLHRYTRDTVNKILNGYLREFRHKLTHRRDELQQLQDSGEASPADRKTLNKAIEAIKDVEAYERDILLPLAQQRLEIDLDDGVKANYPKFGKALAKVTGLS